MQVKSFMLWISKYRWNYQVMLKKTRSHCPQWDSRLELLYTWFILGWAVYLQLCGSCEAELETSLIIQDFLKISYPHFTFPVNANNKEWPLDLFQLFSFVLGERLAFSASGCQVQLLLNDLNIRHNMTGTFAPRHSSSHTRIL